MKKETVKRKDEALWRSVNGDQRMDPMIFGQNKRHQLILAYLGKYRIRLLLTMSSFHMENIRSDV